VLGRAEQALHTAGQVVITGVRAGNLGLAALVATFGVVTAEGNEDATQLVYNLTPKSAPPVGLRTRSHQRCFFPLHTDTSWLPRPHDYLALLGVTPAATSSTKSLTVPVDQIVGELDDSDVAVLCEPRFPVPTQDWPRYVSILEPGTSGGFCIRYRADVLELESTNRLDARARTALQHLDEVVATASAATFALNAGDLLVLDNRRVLHGRTEVDGPRLVERVRARTWSAFAARPLRATQVGARNRHLLEVLGTRRQRAPGQPVRRSPRLRRVGGGSHPTSRPTQSGARAGFVTTRRTSTPTKAQVTDATALTRRTGSRS
jgi:hypothetical protein